MTPRPSPWLTGTLASAVLFGSALAAGLLVGSPARADEGMWTITDFPRERLQKKYNFSPSDEWLQHLQLSAVRVGGGCSGSFVSQKGLVMTNHHCSTSCLEELSSPQRDLLRSGFLASDRPDELRCPTIELRQPRSIGGGKHRRDREVGR